MNFIEELTELCKKHGLEKVQMLNAGLCSDSVSSPEIVYCEVRFEWTQHRQDTSILLNSFHEVGRLI